MKYLLLIPALVACGAMPKEKIRHKVTIIEGVDGKQGEQGTAGTSCKVEHVEHGGLIVCEDGSKIIVRHGSTGAEGVQGEQGQQGAKGDKGDKGDSWDIVESIQCQDDVPNYSGVRFTMQVQIFENGTVHTAVSMYDDESTFGFGMGWQTPAVIYRDKQQNDDWAKFSFQLDRETMQYIMEYTDSVDGDELFAVANKCELL